MGEADLRICKKQRCKPWPLRDGGGHIFSKTRQTKTCPRTRGALHVRMFCNFLVRLAAGIIFSATTVFAVNENANSIAQEEAERNQQAVIHSRLTRSCAFTGPIGYVPTRSAMPMVWTRLRTAALGKSSASSSPTVAQPCRTTSTSSQISSAYPAPPFRSSTESANRASSMPVERSKLPWTSNGRTPSHRKPKLS